MPFSSRDNNSIRIVQIIDSLSVGGMERFVVNLSNGLKQRGIDVSIIVTRNLGDLKIHLTEGIEVYNIEKSSFFDLMAFRRLLMLLKKLNAHSLHVHGPSVYWAVLAKTFLRSKALRMIYHEHDGGFLNKTICRKKLLRYTLNFVTLVLVVSKQQYYYYSSFHRSVSLLNNFPVLNSKFGVSKSSGKIRILHLANFRPEKNHKFLLDVVIEVNRRNLPVEFLLIGRKYDDDYFFEISDLIENSGVENMTLLHNVINPTGYLHSADIGLLCSKYEGLPLTILEYGLAKLAVISTDVGEIGGLLNPRCGIVVSENAEMFTDRLEFLINDRHARINLGEELYKKVKKDYGRDAYIEKYLKLL